MSIESLAQDTFLDLIATNPNHDVWKRCSLISVFLNQYESYDKRKSIGEQKIQQLHNAMTNIPTATKEAVPFFAVLAFISEQESTMLHSHASPGDENYEIWLHMNAPFPGI